MSARRSNSSDGAPRGARRRARGDAPVEAPAEASTEEEGNARVEAPRLPVPARGSVRAVEPVDSLTAYMAELAKYPPISREEEHALGVRWVEQGDVEAARRLVLANLRLVVKIAMEYRRAWTNVLDLIQEGNVGLMQAAHRFDPYQGVKLSSYAAYWIRAYILKYILDNFRMVRLGTTRAQRKLFFRLNREKRQLEQEGFGTAEPRLLAERLEVSEDDVRDMEQRLSQSDLSINAPTRSDDEGSEFGDFLAAGGASAEETVASAELRRVFQEKLQDFTGTLDERDRRIIEERVLSETPRTLQDLAGEFGISRERVRQLEARLVSRLREHMQEQLVDFDYYAPPGSGRES